MSVFEKDFLERVKARRAPAKSRESVTQSENVLEQRGTQQPDSMEELAREARAAGPLIFGPPKHSSIKGSWRDDAKWLAQNFR